MVCYREMMQFNYIISCIKSQSAWLLNGGKERITYRLSRVIWAEILPKSCQIAEYSRFLCMKTWQKAEHFNNLYLDYRCIPFWSLEGGEGALVLFTIGFENAYLCTDLNPDQYKQYFFLYLRPSAVTKRFFKAKKPQRKKKDYIKLLTDEKKSTEERK